MAYSRFFFHAGIAVIAALIVTPAFSQDLGGSLQTSGTAYYRFARPGQSTIEVLVLGGGRSGIYEVGENVNLGQLIALAGGGGAGGRRSKVTVHLFRLEQGMRKKLLEEKMEEFSERAEYPSLRDGDLVRIETREKFNWRDGLRITTTLLSLTTTLLTIFGFRR